MQLYKTAEETASEWNITPRHVQHLCRSGKIAGAIKRAGAWFIPDGAPPPTRNTKSNVQGFMFVGTKHKIFNAAIELFVGKGFNNVSIKDIADAVGIRQSTIYNHFKSKQDILDTIYDYYCHHYLLDRPEVEDLDGIIYEGTILEIMRSIAYTFRDEYRQRLSDITKIIFQRIAIDDRAREIGKLLMIESGISFAEEVFARAADSGRFPGMDAHALSVFVNGVRMFSMLNWIIDDSEENLTRIMTEEIGMFEHAAKYVTLLRQTQPDKY